MATMPSQPKEEQIMAQDKRTTVSGTVAPSLAEFMEDYRWKNRKNRSEVVGDAILSWAKSEGYEEPSTGEVAADVQLGDENAKSESDGAAAEPAAEPAAEKPAAKRAR